jgi:hypothetical protein
MKNLWNKLKEFDLSFIFNMTVYIFLFLRLMFSENTDARMTTFALIISFTLFDIMLILKRKEIIVINNIKMNNMTDKELIIEEKP